MKGKLIKSKDGYELAIPDCSTNKFIASTSGMYVEHKLSLKNCQAIENGYDLDDKISNHLEKNHIEASNRRIQVIRELILEILGGKKYSIENVVELTKILMSNPFEKCGKTYKELVDAYNESLQPNEWEVEIVTEPKEQAGENVWYEPKLDKDGCLILRKYDK